MLSIIRPMRRARRLLYAVLGLGACAPALDWREVRPDGGAVVLLMPCKPDRQVRQVALAGPPVALELLSCRADDTVWVATTADVVDPARVGPALDALRQSRRTNLEGREIDAQPAGAGPLATAASAQRYTVEGRRPDGQPVREHALQFAHGTRVVQVTALGGAPSADALDTFFGGIALPR